ncbi:MULTISPECIES: DUF4240 domain-containing protein [unclassified Streptomyces]|uniref:DUF4240 domain-containing protein n=1 Tax=unclassified Streptomyces TaxID=2593676 RepID=UPI001BE59B58|nr:MULTISPECIES: DUF4240 domain-containing protein [unclassified Streptomyces]MBT2404034.1 DUF4240 domain-containing protein [Streptomyces sp. ISL-21]MBT2455745.1 DUF4240 domain-containing protein [Streptomyces sp. ISL-86]MBT2607921.1 DUF4240 domain-containing protein [Streptomyces sp. ISL-87]
MDKQTFWKLIETARADAEADRVAARAAELLADSPAAEIAAAQQVLWDLLADSYRAPLWAAAYVINGGCSDDGFDYFRGWLLTQGETAFTRALADPDSLADHPAVRAAASEGVELWDEEALSIAWTAYESATGRELPSDSFTISYPDLDPAWSFDFDDAEETASRLPRLSALFG